MILQGTPTSSKGDDFFAGKVLIFRFVWETKFGFLVSEGFESANLGDDYFFAGVVDEFDEFGITNIKARK